MSPNYKTNTRAHSHAHRKTIGRKFSPMAVTKAEENGEDGFGDFTFASFPNLAVHSDQINGRKSIADNDDEWGDFVESPLRSELSNGFSRTQSPPNASEPSRPFDPFGFFSDHSSTPSQLVAIRVQSDKTQRLKPEGALPLSIFGDVEDEEEQSGVVLVDPPIGDAKDSFNDNNVGNMRNGSNLFIGLAINDIVANLYNQSQQIKAENGLNSNVIGINPNLNGVTSNMYGLISNPSGLDAISGLFAGNNGRGSQNQQMNAGSGLNSDSTGLNSNSDLFAGNIDFDTSTNLYSRSQHNKAESGLNSNLNGSNSNLNASTLNLSGLDSNFKGFGLTSNSYPLGGNEELDDDDDDGWEFKDAYSEPKVGDGNDKVDGKEQGNPEVNGFSSEFGNGSHGSIDSFSTSNGFSGKAREVDIGFDFKPLTVAQNGFSSDSFFKSQQNGTENTVNSILVLGTVDSDESFGDFEDAFTVAGLKQEEEPKTNGLSYFEVEVLTSDGNVQGNETRSENHKGALPLSLFGDEELGTDDSLNVQDVFTYNHSSYPSNGINSQGLNISIHDLISNLYSQAEQIPSVDPTEEVTENGLDSSGTALDPSLANADDFDDASWEYKDASSQVRAVDETSLLTPEDANQIFPTKLKFNNYVDFYSKLKDELCFVCRSHLDNLKKAQNAAALSGEDAKVAAIGEEIQEACKELHKENINYKEVYSEDQPPRHICLNEFLEVLHELKFQVLESEYHLSRRLHLAEKDLRSAIDLIKHGTSMLNVLTLGSMEDQSTYVSTWSKLISVCARELKHSSWIWNQLAEKNVQSWVVSEPRGKRFILALGEIYRVILVLGASTELYKPWILSSSVDSTSIYAILDECYTLWSSSGIEEALQGISDPIDFEYHCTVKALQESIKYIHDLDTFALGNHVFNQQVSPCRLSLLPSGAVPEMKMVVWSGQHYFLTLANLWANLISCDPPKLPHLHVV